MKYLILSVMLLSACKSNILVPQAAPETYPQAFDKQSNDVIVDFQHQSWQGHYQQFHLEINNLSSDTLRFYPDSLYYRTFNAQEESTQKQFAYNYLAARQAIKRTIKKSKASKTVLDVATLYQLGPDATNREVNNQYLALDLLPGDYLMQSSIAPGETVSGLIFFPTSKTKHYHFFMPLAGALHEFWFKAEKERSNSIRITVDK